MNQSELRGDSVDILVAPELRAPLEARVSEFLGRSWRVTQATDKTDEASHPAAILSDGVFRVFVKLLANECAWDQANQEIKGLRLLRERAGILTPEIIAAERVGQSVLLVLEAVEGFQKTDQRWLEIGRALAKVHRVKNDRFGLDTHSYLGSLYLDNTLHDNWVDFFCQRRLQPRLRSAVDSGRLPVELVPSLEKIIARLPELCGPAIEPSLLHGDVHTNNILSSAGGPVFFDPAVYYGHPEMDLASVDFFVLAFEGYFTPAPESFYLGYQELQPIDPGYPGRRDLWRIPNWLAMVELDGARHLGSLRDALKKYV